MTHYNSNVHIANGEINLATTTIAVRNGEINSNNIIKFHFEWLMTTAAVAATAVVATTTIKTINM